MCARVCESERERVSRVVAEVIGFTSCQVTGVLSNDPPERLIGCSGPEATGKGRSSEPSGRGVLCRAK